MHSPDSQKKSLKEDVLAITQCENKHKVTGLRRNFEIHKMSWNNGTVEEIVLWVRNARVFKRRATKSVNQDTRNMMNVIVLKKNRNHCQCVQLDVEKVQVEVLVQFSTLTQLANYLDAN